MDLCQAAGPRLQSRQSLPDDSPAVFFCLYVFVFVFVFPSSSPEQSLECPKASKMTRLLALCLVQPILRCPCHVMSKDYHRQDYFLGKCHGQWKFLLLEEILHKRIFSWDAHLESKHMSLKRTWDTHLESKYMSQKRICFCVQSVYAESPLIVDANAIIVSGCISI